MPGYSVLISKSVEKEMDALPKSIHRRASARILGLASDPRPPGSKKLQGLDGHRVRVGDYRVLYTVDDAAQTVTVRSVAHRREAYR